MFLERLKKLRKEAELSQKSLALKLDTSQQNIDYWENGQRNPKKDKLTKIAEFFDVSIDYLLGTTDDPRTQVDIDIDEAIEKSVAYDGKPITDND